MSQYDCSWCKNKFKFKFPYRCWKQVAKIIYTAAERRMTPTLTIAFAFDGREWVIDTSLTHNKLTELGGDLDIALVEPMTRQEFNSRKEKEDAGDAWDYHWPDDVVDRTRTFTLLQTVSAIDADRDMHITVQDFFGSHLSHICGIRKVITGEHTQVHLEEAWSHKP